jgi:1-aminocyclopropane-1-carboxylate deaminase
MRLSIKRLDLLYPEAPGNKYFKLKYNLLKAREKGATRIVTPGGPFSNHLHATAAVCKREGIACTGLVRGEMPKRISPTLRDCLEWGMELKFLERTLYDECNTEAFKHQVHAWYPECWFIPEGGNNFLGVNGCMEILNSEDKTADTLAVPVGTGTTLAGILLSAQPAQRILAFPAVNDRELPNRLRQTVYWTLLDDELTDDLASRVNWIWDFTFGGFARMTAELEQFMNEQAEHGLPLDRVYTAKMLFGLHSMAAEGRIAYDERVVALHTGGLQGNRELA